MTDMTNQKRKYCFQIIYMHVSDNNDDVHDQLHNNARI